MEKETEKQNLGSGSIPGLMIKLAVPTIIAQLVNLLYNLVDRIYIGHIREVGDIALTGLGLCFPVLMMVTAFAMLIGSGGAPRAAIYMGKGDNETAERILGNSVTSLIVISVVLTIFLEAVAEPILWMFGASEKTLPFALGYMRIYVAGSIFVMMTLGLNMFITTQGFAKISMKTVLIGAICNIIPYGRKGRGRCNDSLTGSFRRVGVFFFEWKTDKTSYPKRIFKSTAADHSSGHGTWSGIICHEYYGEPYKHCI